MSLYLNVPYSQKEEAKALGAKWNPRVKKWYVNCSYENFNKYAKWLLDGFDSVLIAMDELFIIEGDMKCWSCGALTTVFGLGLNNFVRLFDKDGEIITEYSHNFISTNALFRLAYTDKIENIPPALLMYIRKNYSVRNQYSRSKNRVVFANHCQKCKKRLGNWYVYDRPESPFSTDFSNGRELKSRMECLDIKCIPIMDEIPLHWKCSYTPNDFAYLEYANTTTLKLTNNKDGIMSYADLFLADTGENDEIL